MSNRVFYDKETDRFYYDDKGDVITPITLCYHIGYKCNLNCDYCLSKNGVNGASAKNLINYIKYIKDWKPLRIVISGGEPLLYIKELSAILKCLKDSNINTFVSTNGTLIEKEYSKIRGLVDWYDISLPAISKETYFNVRGEDRFKEVLRGIDFLVKNGERIRLTFTINEHNENEVLDFPEFAIACGVDNIRIGHTYSYFDGKIKQKIWKNEYQSKISKYNDKLKIYYPLSDKQLALYNNGYIVLESDGSVYRSMVNRKNYICNIAEVEKYKDTFSKIGKLQIQLFAEENYGEIIRNLQRTS